MEQDDPAPGGGDPSGKASLSRRRFLAVTGLTATSVLLAACSRSGPGPTVLPASATAGTSLPPGPSAVPSDSPEVTPPAKAVRSLPPRPRDNAITAENARAGDRRWDDPRTTGLAAAYLGVPSVGPGEQVRLRASGSGTFDVDWYRLGWYGGTGGRLLRTDRGVAVRPQPRRGADPVTGLVEAGWAPALETSVPGAPSGMLLAVLRTPAGRVAANVPVVLRPDPSRDVRSRVLFVSAAATWQAYNFWGGFDLYGDATRLGVPSTGGRRAVMVSFDRPYARDGGAGLLRRWELQFIRWLERNGRDVEYMADIDLERNPGLADGRQLIVMAGHPEYWSRPMRTRLEAAVAAGTNVAFLTANEVYWQVRLEAGPAGPASRIVCYKSAAADPMTAVNPSLATCQWREAPVSDPEATLVGQQYGEVVRRPADWVVADPGHWLYEGTRFVTGDRIRNLVGQEYDTVVPDLAPPGTTVIARGPVDAKTGPLRRPGALASPRLHTATVYTADSGATVVAAGTFQWSWAIDGYGSRSYAGRRTPLDRRVDQMTRNLFNRIGDGPLAP